MCACSSILCLITDYELSRAGATRRKSAAADHNETVADDGTHRTAAPAPRMQSAFRALPAE